MVHLTHPPKAALYCDYRNTSSYAYSMLTFTATLYVKADPYVDKHMADPCVDKHMYGC